jgi:predicted small secreted protein
MVNQMRGSIMHSARKKFALLSVLLVSLLLGGCNANVGVGMSVGVPIGNHGYMNVGTGRWL